MNRARENQIIHERGPFWICDADGQYTVYRNNSTHAVADSSYPRTIDGRSLAVARCNYLAERRTKTMYRYHPSDRGCYADGANGHGHIRARLADLVEEIGRGDLADELRGDPPDDLSDEEEAIDALQEVTDPLAAWSMLDGDLLLITD